MHHHLRAAAPVAVLAALTIATAPASAGRFDGSWSMTAVTTKGHCWVIPVTFSITRGRILPRGGSYAFYPIRLTGRVSPSGAASLKAITGPRIALGQGRFRGEQGRGTWRGTGPSGVCFGTWTATRS